MDALAVDEDEVTPEATLTSDLGAESIDFSTSLKLEQTFGFKIEQGVLPRQRDAGPRPQNGRVTAGMTRLKERLPHADFEARVEPRGDEGRSDLHGQRS